MLPQLSYLKRSPTVHRKLTNENINCGFDKKENVTSVNSLKAGHPKDTATEIITEESSEEIQYQTETTKPSERVDTSSITTVSKKRSKHVLLKKLMENLDEHKEIPPVKLFNRQENMRDNYTCLSSPSRRCMPKCESRHQKNLVVNVVSQKIQNQNDLGNSCMCCRFSNSRSDESISKQRPRSVPSSEKCFVRKCRNPRNIELFNPNYSFDTNNKSCKSNKLNVSLIDSIKRRVFHNQGDAVFNSTGKFMFYAF